MSDFAVQQQNAPHAKTVYLKDYKLPGFFIDETLLHFDLYDEYTLVTSRYRIRRNRLSQDNTHELILQGEGLILEAIQIDDQALAAESYTLTDKHLIIQAHQDKFNLTLKTKIFPQKNTALSGLYRVKDTYCTQCEAEGFRRITYFLDHPDVLSRFTTTITADAKKFPYLLSNGNLIESGPLEEGRHFAKWEDPFKKPSYLFALVAGDFDVVTDKFVTVSGREVDLRMYVERGLGDQVDHAVYSLKEAMRWDERTYGREYDLDIYMIVATSDFNMGAMENKGLNIFNTKYILAKPETATDNDYIHILSVVGHEYFHNWSGNRVTCRDWFQLSLKEGLTIFRDQLFTEDLISPTVMRIHDVRYLREVQFTEDASPLAHPVRPDSYIEINNFYTATVYNKGAEVLRMLRTILGTAVFRKGMDLYFARHDGQAVTIEDYIQTMEDVSGIDLNQFRLWYSQAGTPTLNISDDYDESNKLYTLTISQTSPPTPGQAEKKPLWIPIRMGLLDHYGNVLDLQLENAPASKEMVLHLKEPSQMFQFKNVDSRPVPSLLRDFSAPVILQYPYSPSDLILLLKHDNNLFNRYEAGQLYALQLMLNLIRDYQQQKPLIAETLNEWLGVFQYLLRQPTQDNFFLAEMLSLPSEKYIGEQLKVIDVNAIHAVREFVRTQIAQQLQALLLEVYQQNAQERPYQFNITDVGKRQLKNACLSYLLLLPDFAALGMQQFNQALKNNMTDCQAAFAGLVNSVTPLREQAINHFYQTWQHDALVLDKWFALQAMSKLPNTLQQVKKLMRHEAFDLKNPNKVYALIGSFANQNQIHFHAENGEGYAFLRDVVQQLDRLNPQIAARMVKPLTLWQRYNKERQHLMKEQLEILLQDSKLSKDVYELASKSLIK
jgi:aminopeptidase N